MLKMLYFWNELIDTLMKQIIYFLTIIFLTCLTISCEEDDICLGGEGTPLLPVVFKDLATNQKQADSLYIAIVDENFQNPQYLYEGIYADSLLLPLGSLNQSVSHFQVRRKKLGINDNLTIHYENKSTFVSKACGFKLTYDDLSFESTHHDIANIVLNSNVLENESTTSLYIYYPN